MIFLETLTFSLTVTAPIFFWMALGVSMKRVGCLSPSWINRGSWLMFYAFLPLLMFISMLRKPLNETFDPSLIIACAFITFIVWLFARKITHHKKLNWADRVVYQQGAVRGNLGIIGISLCLNAYGEVALVSITLLMALLAVFYNILCTFIFVSREGAGLSMGRRLLKLAANPLILSSAVGLVFNILGVRPEVELMDDALNLIQYTFPVALICVGGSFVFHSMMSRAALLLEISVLKLLVMPFLSVLCCWLLGYRGDTLGMVFLLTASPAATAGFIMAKAYGANAELSADVVVSTTVLSLISISSGVFLLRVFEII